MGEYGGLNFKKSGGKVELISKQGNKGIPPEASGVPKGSVSKGIDFPGKKGDKGLGCVKGMGGHQKSPLD